MPWSGNMACRRTRRMTAVAALVLIAAVVGCTKQDAVETLGRTVEGTARAACEQAGNCRNSCPDGTTARGPFYQCR